MEVTKQLIKIICGLTKPAAQVPRTACEEMILGTAAALGVEAVKYRELHPHDLAQVAGERGVAIRAGHHCAQPLLSYLGHSATARASFSVYNDEADVHALVDAILSAHEMFSG